MIYLIAEQSEEPVLHYIPLAFFYEMQDAVNYLKSCKHPISHLLLFPINEQIAYNIEMLDGYPAFYKRN